MADALRNAAKDPAVVSRIEGIGLFADYEDPAAARQRLETEYKDIVDSAGSCNGDPEQGLSKAVRPRRNGVKSDAGIHHAAGRWILRHS